MRREGRRHKLGAEEMGVNRIFKASYSLTPSASALHPSASSQNPSSTQTIPQAALAPRRVCKAESGRLGPSQWGLLHEVARPPEDTVIRGPRS